MQWLLKDNDNILVNLLIDDITILSIMSKTKNPVISSFTLWKDTSLTTDLQEAWLLELRKITEVMKEEAKIKCTKNSKFPQNSELRDQILTRLADQYLTRHFPDWITLNDLQALLELAIYSKCTIYCICN